MSREILPFSLLPCYPLSLFCYALLPSSLFLVVTYCPLFFATYVFTFPLVSAALPFFALALSCLCRTPTVSHSSKERHIYIGQEESCYVRDHL